jgi:hypothetical protein
MQRADSSIKSERAVCGGNVLRYLSKVNSTQESQVPFGIVEN